MNGTNKPRKNIISYLKLKIGHQYKHNKLLGKIWASIKQLNYDIYCKSLDAKYKEQNNYKNEIHNLTKKTESLMAQSRKGSELKNTW